MDRNTADYTVGIDLGTSNSCIAVWRNGMAEIIEMPGDQRVLPSVVTFPDKDSDPVVGQAAINVSERVPQWCFDRVKLLMGMRWHEGEDTGGKTVEGFDGFTWLRGPDRNYSPSEIAAFLIITMLDAAEAKLGVRPTGAIMTVPAGFDGLQEQAVRKAAHLAGLRPDRVELLQEPTAAALAHGYLLTKFATLAIYDLGGGTFDISIIQAGKKGVAVLGADGNAKLGGTNFDDRLVGHAVRGFFTKHKVDLGTREETMDRIRMAAEAAKKELTDSPKSAIRVQYVDTTGPDGILELDEAVTREEFEALVSDLVGQTIDICKRAMAQGKVLKTDIDDVILVGGMTHVPCVREAVTAFFGKKPRLDINPKEVVAIGAAIHAAVRDGRTDAVKLSNRISHSLGLETMANRVFEVFPKGTPFGVEKTVIVTSDEDNQAKLSVYVRQGGDLRADKNVILGREHFDIEPAPAGEPSLEVTFRVDEQGVIEVRHGDVAIFEGTNV